MNGVESEATKVIKEVTQLAKDEEKSTPEPSAGEGSDTKDASEDEFEESSGALGANNETPAKSTRSKTKSDKTGKKK
jgi:hypothetical protein